MSTLIKYSVVLSCLVPLICSAQVLEVRPGLWQHQLEISSESGQLEQMLALARMQMAMLPPAQRTAVENMLSSQGISMDFENQSFRNCVSSEETALDHFTLMEGVECSKSSVTESAAGTRFQYDCGSGHGEIVLHDDSNYSGNSRMTLMLAGQSEVLSIAHRGQWVEASCAVLGQ